MKEKARKTIPNGHHPVNMQMDQGSMSFSCITAFRWANRSRQQYRLSHSRWTRPSGAGTVTHWCDLAAKQRQEQPLLLTSLLDSSSHPHRSYLSSRVAISTPISKLVPGVACSPSFSSIFSPHLLLLPGFSSLHHYSTHILFSFTAQHSFYSQLSVQVYTFCSSPAFSCTPNLSHAASVFTLRDSACL